MAAGESVGRKRPRQGQAGTAMRQRAAQPPTVPCLPDYLTAEGGELQRYARAFTEEENPHDVLQLVLALRQWIAAVQPGLEENAGLSRAGSAASLSAVLQGNKRRPPLWRRGRLAGQGCWGPVHEVLNPVAPTAYTALLVQRVPIHPDSSTGRELAERLDALSSLEHHPNLVSYNGWQHAPDKRGYDVFTTLGGVRVKGAVQDPGLDQIQLIARGCLEGLVHLHKHGVVHGALRAASIYIDSKGPAGVRLADFGIPARMHCKVRRAQQGRLLSPGVASGHKKPVDGLLGVEQLTEPATPSSPFARTPASWIAPELRSLGAEGVTGLAMKGDIWSLGCALLDIARAGSGRRTSGPGHNAVIGGSTFSGRLAILASPMDEGEPVIPAELNPALANFLQLCLTADPDQRPGARELLRHRFLCTEICHWALHSNQDAFVGADAEAREGWTVARAREHCCLRGFGGFVEYHGVVYFRDEPPSELTEARVPVSGAYLHVLHRPPKQRVVGGWVIGKVLGSGRFGTVYLAHQLGERAAAKHIVTQDASDLLQEVGVLRKVQHPNIVRYLGCHLDLSTVAKSAAPGHAEGARAFIFMEVMECALTALIREWKRYAADAASCERLSRIVFVPARALVLGRYLKRSHLRQVMLFDPGIAPAGELVSVAGGLPEWAVRCIAAQLLHGLAHLHGLGIVHRDVKCDNVLCAKDGTVKLADFGLAAGMSDVALSESLNGPPRGTPTHMAPEVWRGSANVDPHAADIWSLGCVVLELLQGFAPFHGRYEEWAQISYALLKRHETPVTILPPGTSAEAGSFLQSCFSHDPSARPAAALLLEAPFAAGQGVTVRPRLFIRDLVHRAALARSLADAARQQADAWQHSDSNASLDMHTWCSNPPHEQTPESPPAGSPPCEDPESPAYSEMSNSGHRSSK
eukprot:TRINITY_DN22954_c0_g1_i2.p1 TRINITY_DN22954_c0_g1~~TRINITY_DN22954_c0_g1_i2.p1  ORF type:complete len:920 (+),score=172.90 TRINITY_DN22954_c0_g1_i2:97-2856(+)